MLPESVLRLAESLNSHLPLGPEDERIERPGWVVWLGSNPDHPAFTVVQRFRLSESEVETAVAAIRELLRDRGRARSTWEVGPSATPSDLYDRLLALGLVPFEEPVATGMVLRRPLQVIDTGVVARRAVTVEDYVAGFELLHAVFGERTESDEARRARAVRDRGRHEAGAGALFVAELDGRCVAAASSLYTEDAAVLSGAATLPEARGRGAYRALVAARYEAAVAVGKPTLVIQAGAMSRPILERLGFESVAQIRILVDAGAA